MKWPIMPEVPNLVGSNRFGLTSRLTAPLIGALRRWCGRCRRSTARELEILSDLARSLVTTPNSEELYLEIVSAVGRVLNFNDCVLYLWDEEEHCLVQKAAHGPKRVAGTSEIVDPLRLSLGQGVVGSAGLEMRSFLVPDVSKDPKYVPDLEVGGSELAVPIVFQDRLQGVLDAECRWLNCFGRDHIEILERFAALCAPAIVSARRLERERREARRLLEQTTSQYREIVERTSDSVYRLDLEGRIHYINPSGSSLLGREPEELVGRSFVEFVEDASRVQFEEYLRRVGACGKDSVTFDLPLVQPSGEVRWVELNLGPSCQASKVVGFHAISRDVSRRRELEEELSALANFDSVTGLFNRHRFERELESELVRLGNSQGRSVLFLLDIDQFKDVNDSYGHAAGDTLLRKLGETLQGQLRQSDFLARLGGDEFAVLVRDTSGGVGTQAAKRLVEAVHAQPFSVGDSLIRVSISLGLALLPGQGDTVAEALLHADLAMYAAKEAGRNTWHTFDPGDEKRDEIQARLSIVETIRSALEGGTFLLYAQPILRLDSGSLRRFEILLRLPDDNGGVLMPGGFIPVAERAGLVCEIDRWVVDRSIEMLALADREIEFEINLSGRSLSDVTLLENLRMAIRNGSLDPSQIIFEITETAAVSDLKRAHVFIEELQSMGIRFAIDDFGVGFSSFYYLKHLPVNYLKIDGSFIREMATSTVDQNIVKSMAEMAQSLGLQTVAEFVQDEETLRLLAGYGVDFAQGYFLGEPAPAEAVISGMSLGVLEPDVSPIELVID